MALTSLSAPKNARIGKALQFKAGLREMRILESSTAEFPAFKISGDAAKNRGQSKTNKGKDTVRELLDPDKLKENLRSKSFSATLYDAIFS